MKLGLALSTNTQMDTSIGWGRGILEQIIPTMERVLAQQETQGQPQAQQDWQKYVGRYSIPGIMEVDLVIFDGNLAACLPAGSPPNVILTPEGESTFRMKGAMVNGELAVFETDSQGRIGSLKAGSYVLERKQE